MFPGLHENTAVHGSPGPREPSRDGLWEERVHVSSAAQQGAGLATNPFFVRLLFVKYHSSSWSRTIKGLFERTWRPSRALNLASRVGPELHRYWDTVMCGALSVEVPCHRKNN